MIFFGVPHLATYVFFLFENEPGLGTLINQAWLLHHFHIVWMRQDSNPQPFDHESSFLSTRPGIRPKTVF